MCPDCEHTAHAGRCFHTEKIEGRYVTCQCKTRAEPAAVQVEEGLWLDPSGRVIPPPR